MSTACLKDYVYVRSGDKGANANIGVIVRDPDDYEMIESQVTNDKVADIYDEYLEGPVDRYELPNLGALNFVLHEVLDGGGITSLRSDAQGKALCEALLQLEIEVPD
jgi:hypothetical protein